MCFAAVARADTLLNAPAFSTAPKDLLAAAAAAPPLGDVYVLAGSTEIVLEPGRETDRQRVIALVRTRAGVAQWTDYEEPYAPPYAAPPTIRARVIDTNGRVTELDSSTIVDAPDPRLPGSDRRRLTAKLPNVTIGTSSSSRVLPTR
jgi:hypothetical protein